MELKQLNGLHENRLDNTPLEALSPKVMAEEKQLQAEEPMIFQASFLDQICQAVIATDKERRITYWNSYATKLYQWEASEVIGKSLDQVTVPQISRQKTEEIIEQVAKQGCWKGELLVKRKDETQFWVEVAHSAIKDSNGQTVGLIEFSVEASDRQQAESQVVKSEQRYRIVSELISDFAYAARIDTTGKLIADWTTGAFSRICGFTCNEIAEKGGWQALIHPDDLPIFQQRLETLLHWQSDISEYRIFTKDGEIRWLRDYSQPVECDEKQHVLVIYGAAQDITERKQAEEALHQQTERERLLGLIQERIRQSLNLDEILRQAVAEIRSFLQVERVVIYQIQPGEEGAFVVESVIPGCASIQGMTLEHLGYGGENARIFAQGYVSVIDNINRTDLDPRAIEQLTALGIQASLVVPILQGSPEFPALNSDSHTASKGQSQVTEIESPSLSTDAKFRVYTHSAQRYAEASYSPQHSATRKQATALSTPLHGSKLQHSALTKDSGLSTKLWGLLCAHDCSGSRQWQPFEIDSLQQLASKIAIAIQQSELYQQIQQLNADLELQVQQRTRELQKALEFESALKRITDKVRDSLDENQILETAVRELAVGLGMSGCNASLYDLEKGTSTICFEYAVTIPAEQGRVAQMGNFRELYYQLLNGQYFQFCSILPNPVRGRVAMLACPILDNQGAIGDLWLINHKESSFSDLEIRLVQQVANQCAIAIRQARLYQAAQAQVAELEKLNRLKDDFLSTVSHELRTPMSNIKMAIQMLRLAPSNERRERYLDILQTECNRETELINDLLDLQRLEADSYPLLLSEAVNLQEWIPSLVEPFYSRAQDHQQTLKIELASDLPPLISNHDGLGRILAELLNNACKYTPAGGAIILRVSQPNRSQGREVTGNETRYSPSPIRLSPSISVMRFTVSNQAEIPANELPHLFEKFYRVPKADLWKQGGTGLGLALVQKLAEQMGGTVTVAIHNGWTTFHVEFPTNP